MEDPEGYKDTALLSFLEEAIDKQRFAHLADSPGYFTTSYRLQRQIVSVGDSVPNGRGIKLNINKEIKLHLDPSQHNSKLHTLLPLTKYQVRKFFLYLTKHHAIKTHLWLN
jgi:hypothetical protein